ncbi:hypothetical protein F4820DRAFT_468786 [Hypoxylon rubiginosum]|uniref:Uncharacterized protein n=1 Tax=Hypoxylon rubiginosum TaxID=110542 RepID=A0ACB9Z486_9PEZI|nr:hypothetical protein F4820DRAFT_468786 [Hypoxylon rubiginosum]
MYIKSTIVHLLLATTSVFAAPTVDTLARRSDPLPTLDECKKHLTVNQDTSLFWTRTGNGNKLARDWRNKDPSRKGYKFLRDVWDDNWAKQWYEDIDKETDFFNLMSQAFAELSSGTVYTALPECEGLDWTKGSTWDAFEWPYLPDNVKVIRINKDFDEFLIKGDGSGSYWPSYPPGDYKTGHCTLHATQWDLASKQGGNNRYDVEVHIFSSAGSGDTIGYHPPMNAGPDHPLRIVSRLKDVMEVTPESQGDYIQFTVGGTSWTSGDTGDTGCSVGKWDGSNYPSYREMDCGFPC